MSDLSPYRLLIKSNSERARDSVKDNTAPRAYPYERRACVFGDDDWLDRVSVGTEYAGLPGSDMPGSVNAYTVPGSIIFVGFDLSLRLMENYGYYY